MSTSTYPGVTVSGELAGVVLIVLPVAAYALTTPG
jgi:hypothetical protein